MPKQLEEIRKKISSKLKGKINPRTRKPYTESEIWAISQEQYKRMSNKEWKFSSGLEIKEDGKDFYIEGFISTPDFDGEGDRFVNQQLIVDQLNNNPEAKIGSLHHDRSGSALTITEEAKLIDNKAWMRAKLNSEHPNFDSTVKEIKNGAINGFSLEHSPILWFENETYNPETNRGRDIVETHVYGYGLASRPINPEASINNFYVKEFINNKENMDSNLIAKEDIQMKDENKLENKKEVKEEEKKDEKIIEEDKKEDKEFKEFLKYKEMKKIEEKEKELKEKVLKVIEEKEKSNSPNINSGNHFDSVVEDQEVIDYNMALGYEVKENTKIETKEGPLGLDMQWKAANKLVNKYPSIARRSGIITSREYKEVLRNVEYKATLTKTTSEASQYYQAVAELNDVYDPIIYNTMNDEAVSVNLFTDVNHAGKQMIQFRNLTAGLTAGGYDEGNLTSDVSTSTMTIKKNEQDFANYAVRFELTGQIMASSTGGGIGDLFGMYARRAAVDLIKKINSDFINGAVGTYTGSDDKYLLGALFICSSSGTIYGRSRSSNTYLQGNTTAAGSTDLTLAHLRTAKRTVIKNGASLNNLVFVTSYFQADRIRGIYQNMQRMVPTSSKAGFEGRIEIDGIPVFEDQHCADANLFLFDRESLKKATQVAPTITEMGITGDTRSAFIKTYFNFYCTAHQRQYCYTGFTTS